MSAIKPVVQDVRKAETAQMRREIRAWSMERLLIKPAFGRFYPGQGPAVSPCAYEYVSVCMIFCTVSYSVLLASFWESAHEDGSDWLRVLQC